uniref:P-type ATPase n=1 Tax=Timema genevievae TaxID=629358 RepID=A0A7R9K6X2_TIMGE|nr:unnamed protein product [Timema genevievae]
MATCHSLTNIEGKLTGDPLDLTMFEATQWDLIEPGQDKNRYDMFTPTVVKPLHKEYQDKTKWVGVLDMETSELIITNPLTPSQLARPCSKLVGLALTSLPSAPDLVSARVQPNFHQVETDLEFIGLLITQNMLKPESLPVIQELTAARIRCVMVTGDNILTAVSVARNCGMVLPNEWVIQVKAQAPDETHSSRITYKILDTTVENSYTYSDCMSIMQCEKWHFALDGKSWAAVCSHFPELLPYILTKGIVFSRMGPDQKTQLVESLQNLDYIVAMCGDGANDCGGKEGFGNQINLFQDRGLNPGPSSTEV